MGKPTTKKKKHVGLNISDTSSKHGKQSEHSPRKVMDADTSIFVDMSNEIKEEGNKLFQKKDYEGALLKYEKAIKLLPKNHADAAYLHSNMAACFMQMGPKEYPRAINECNLALEISPKYTKALLKRAKCFEALNRLDLAYKDVEVVLESEPNNLTGLEISERVKKGLEKKGIKPEEIALVPSMEPLVVKVKPKKKKSHKTRDKMIVNEEKHSAAKEEPHRLVKLVFVEDIRWAQLPPKCSILQLREIIRGKFPNLKAMLVKYKDNEGDLVTITTSEELRWAEECAESQGSLRLFIVEVSPEQDPHFDEEKSGAEIQGSERNPTSASENGSSRHEEEKVTSCIEDWIVQFALLFKNHVGFNSDSYLDLHELGMKLYTEAIEETVTSEEAQGIFEIATDKFQEMTALALFNWGNVHMSRALKRLFFQEDSSKESVLTQVKSGYEWAQGEYAKAGRRYEEALEIKPDFYEGYLALGRQQFEQARLTWYFTIGNKVDLDNWPSSEVLELFNNSEDSMEKGIELWEEMEEQQLKGLRDSNKDTLLKEMGLDGLFKGPSAEEAAEVASNMRSQINLFWGTMLYERSTIEFKLSLPTWEDCLMAAVEKFKLAGVPPSDIAVMIKNHSANKTTEEGLSFNIDEIVQAWNEIYDTKRWMSGVPSSRLEPLFRRKVPKLHNVLETL
ncbi:protein PHOX1 [Dioscorea cayenensis subsp. rotundata]|uniref:Protein PHOX1 n=1 Tax=Dioscorea cayennensis subsp. rotundata TaxID=55577 RepID=A0AB40BX47_DIOCR|nr:protein PHOX1 [Dioscorea cayenensis subsp. rotundata]